MSYDYQETLTGEDVTRSKIKLSLVAMKECPFKIDGNCWQNDPYSWPNVTYPDIYHYLIESPGKFYPILLFDMSCLINNGMHNILEKYPSIYFIFSNFVYQLYFGKAPLYDLRLLSCLIGYCLVRRLGLRPAMKFFIQKT